MSTTMKKISHVEVNSFLNDEGPADADLPEFMKKAASNKATTSIKPNTYNSNTYNYRDMVLKCMHISKSQQDALINIFFLV